MCFSRDERIWNSNHTLELPLCNVAQSCKTRWQSFNRHFEHSILSRQVCCIQSGSIKANTCRLSKIRVDRPIGRNWGSYRQTYILTVMKHPELTADKIVGFIEERPSDVVEQEFLFVVCGLWQAPEVIVLFIVHGPSHI